MGTEKVEPEVTEHRRPGGYMGWMDHNIIYPKPVERAVVEKYVEDEKSFGYHPSGYGGSLMPHDQKSGTNWVYTHSMSCD